MVADVYRVNREVHVALCVPHWADRRHGVGALVGCGTVEDGKKLRSERVIDFDHVDGRKQHFAYYANTKCFIWKLAFISLSHLWSCTSFHSTSFHRLYDCTSFHSLYLY